MRGTRIIVSTLEGGDGRKVEGFLGTDVTASPGQVVQVDHSVALRGGRHTWKLYDADADGGRPKGPFIVLTEDRLQGRTASDSYAAGERAFGYIPRPGDELNVLVANLTGTADDHAAGEMLIVDDTTGKFIATTGSPETEVAQLMEAITDPTADTLAWVEWTGY